MHPLVTFAPKLDWSYRPPEGSTEEDCEEYDYEDIMTENLGDLARCTLSPQWSRRAALPSLESTSYDTSKLACRLTVEKLPTCFYHIIKTLREYPDAPELKSVTEEMLNTSSVPGNFKFEDTPPALAYLLLDAMRSAYGESFLRQSWRHGTRSGFGSWMPWIYEGDESIAHKLRKQPQTRTLSRIGNGWQHAGSRRMVLA